MQYPDAAYQNNTLLGSLLNVTITQGLAYIFHFPENGAISDDFI